MVFPARSFYTIQELSIRWGRLPFDIIGWAMDGHFDLAVALPPTRIGDRMASGMVRIAACDVFTLFRHDRFGMETARIRRIKETGNAEDWGWITTPEEGIEIGQADVLIPREDVVRFETAFGLYGQAPDAIKGSPRSRKFTERPFDRRAENRGIPKHDWDRFYLAVIRRINNEGLPKSQAELIAEMQDWFDNEYGPDAAPDESTIRKKVKLIWNDLSA